MHFHPLAQFFDRSQIGSWFPTVRYQSTNPSPCTFGPIDANCMVKWRPVSTGETNCIPIQEIEPFVLAGTSEISSDSRSHLTDVLQFVTSFWSAPLDCRYGYVRIVLDCGVWNDGDLKRKRVLLRDSVNRMLQSETDVIYPVAWNNDASGMCVGMNLTTGEICTADIETGERDHLAASLSDFLGGLRCVDAYFSETVQSF